MLAVAYADYDRVIKSHAERRSRSIIRICRQIPVFSRWPVQNLRRLAEALSEEEFMSGSLIAKQGVQCNSIVILTAGRVLLQKRADLVKYARWPSGAQRWEIEQRRKAYLFDIIEITSVDTICEDALLTIDGGDFTIRCLTNCTGLVLKRQDFMLLFGENTLQYFRKKVISRREIATTFVSSSLQQKLKDIDTRTHISTGTEKPSIVVINGKLPQRVSHRQAMAASATGAEHMTVMKHHGSYEIRNNTMSRDSSTASLPLARHLLQSSVSTSSLSRPTGFKFILDNADTHSQSTSSLAGVHPNVDYSNADSFLSVMGGADVLDKLSAMCIEIGFSPLEHA